MPDITLKRLAEMLNLSISTVSRALKDHPDISKETRQKVKELAAVAEYEPNTYAINLRTNQSRELAVIIPTIANDFYQSFISSLEEEVRLYGYSLIMLQSGDDPLIEQQNLKRCRQGRVSGIFISITTKTTDISSFFKQGDHPIPIIFFDKVPAFENCIKICVDDVMAAAIAAKTLMAKNKQNILGVFGNEELSITKKRLSAFIETLEADNPGARLTIHHASSINESFNVVMNALTHQQPDAIFCMSDEVLIGVMKAIQTLQLRIPGDVGVIAISEGQVPTFYYPQITFIETSGFKLAKSAFVKMMACIAGSTGMQEIKINAVLVEGGSL
jgi:LacI family transcriptional regulator